MGETIKVQRRLLPAIAESFKLLDGTADKVPDIDGDSSWNLAKDRTIFEREAHLFGRLKDAIFRKHKIVPGVRYGADRTDDINACMEEISQFEDGEVEISGILMVDRKSVQKPGVPIGALSGLMPILREKS